MTGPTPISADRGSAELIRTGQSLIMKTSKPRHGKVLHLLNNANV